ncbi:hypothetical protein [Algoriphagus sediminis]|uniref:RND transporter n=1 Tax=Algoriphagus sediminis TaxID=3057113 RepID=A0ABT7YA35_9BACT|nr:hypothetical protein [Algoriphagus sediminis]MDN3203388.1 hypothetical protein [Algoriphagus sediminis]
MDKKKGFITWLKKSWSFFLVISLTLGLAPFKPEPHLFGKIKWVMGGAKGMQAMDWFDLLLHGTPWILLLFSLIAILLDRKKVPVVK